MIYDIWYMIYDIWYMIYDIWYMIYDIWYMIYNIWNGMIWTVVFNKKGWVGSTSSYNFDLFEGGQRVGDLGYFVQPTVFAEVCKY